MLGHFNHERIKAALDQTRHVGGLNDDKTTRRNLQCRSSEENIHDNDDDDGDGNSGSLWDELYHVYWKKNAAVVDGSKRWKGNGNLVEPLVASGHFKVSFTINLLPDAEGYTITLAAKNGSGAASTSIPYQDTELLEYLDSQQIPPMLLDILCDNDSCFLYCGCLIAEVRDYRCYHINMFAYNRHLVLLKPTNQTLAMAVDEMARESNLSQEEKLSLESKLLLATERPLCLDPSPDVLAVTSHIYCEQDIYNSHVMRKAIKHQSPAAASRLAARRLEPVPPKFAVHDFILSSQHQKINNPAALMLKSKHTTDMWKRRPLQLSTPSSRDVVQLAKSLELDGRENEFALELLQSIEIKLDTTSGREGPDCCKLNVYRCPSDGEYSIVVTYGQHGVYHETQSTRHQLGQRAEAQKYLNRFLDSYARTAPLKSVLNRVEGKLSSNKSNSELSPFVKRSSAELALCISNPNKTLFPEPDSQLRQMPDCSLSSVPSQLSIPSVSFIAPDTFVPTSKAVVTPRPAPAKVSRRHSVSTPLTRKASTSSKETLHPKSPASSVASPMKTAASVKFTAPLTRSGGVRRGNAVAVRNRRSSLPVSSADVQQTSTSTEQWGVGGTGQAGQMNIQSSNSVTKTANESPLSSAAQGSVTAAMVTSRLPSGSQVSVPTSPMSQMGSHQVISTMGLQTVGRLTGGKFTTVVLPSRSVNSGVSLPQAQITVATQKVGTAVSAVSSARGHVKSLSSPSQIASIQQSPYHIRGQALAKSNSLTCTIQQLGRSAVGLTTMAIAQHGSELQLVQGQHCQPIALPASAKQVLGQQRPLGQPILVHAPGSYHSQGAMPVQTVQFLSQQLPVSRPKGGGSKSSVSSGATGAQKLTPTAVSHPAAVRLVFTPGQTVSHMPGKQVFLQLPPTFGLTQPMQTLQQQPAQHVAPQAMQSMALPASNVVVPLQISASSTSTAPATANTGKTP
ncbi:transcription factor SPT20 homolog isoform X2 [Corticium candelabrum]|uniref:transcription factor SPT20 homolog isoform X2 n=1 Tax=Corticium candelabrum TaxID=121492 RepID=UPI002E276BE8|nr:transcription factor SPT20 homolog isoform X2 [Corticium candelabrum]